MVSGSCMIKYLTLFVLLALWGCSDYVSEIDSRYEKWMIEDISLCQNFFGEGTTFEERNDDSLRYYTQKASFDISLKVLDENDNSYSMHKFRVELLDSLQYFFTHNSPVDSFDDNISRMNYSIYQMKKNGKSFELVVEKSSVENYLISYTYANEDGSLVKLSYETDSDYVPRLGLYDRLEYSLVYRVPKQRDGYYDTLETSQTIVLANEKTVVKILKPQYGEKISVEENPVQIHWTVNDVPKDTLVYVCITEGTNEIVRSYRDPWGNETSDTIIVLGKLRE